ncbi:LOW QUALITY PROTEIN: hypothetical protein U9M48_017904, partial [Paspalum notatum var. saurae]
MGSAGFTNRFGTHAASAANDASCTPPPPLCRTAATPAVTKLWAMRMPCFSRRWSPIRSTGADTNGALKRNVGSTAAPALTRFLAPSVAMAEPSEWPASQTRPCCPATAAAATVSCMACMAARKRDLPSSPLRSSWRSSSRSRFAEPFLVMVPRKATTGDGGGRGVEEVERRLERVDGAEDGAVGGVDEHLPQFELKERPPRRRAGVGALTVPLPVSLQDVDALDKARHDGSAV